MAVRIQFFSVVVPLDVIGRFPGLRERLADAYTMQWQDEHLWVTAAMAPPRDVAAFLEEAGLTLRDTSSGVRTWKDICIVDYYEGPTNPCPWLEVDLGRHIAWKKGTAPGEIAGPALEHEEAPIKLSDETMAALVQAQHGLPAAGSASPGGLADRASTSERPATSWAVVEMGPMKVLGFAYNDPAAGPSVKGALCLDGSLVTAASKASSQPNMTSRLSDGMACRFLSADEVTALRLPPSPPWFAPMTGATPLGHVAEDPLAAALASAAAASSSLPEGRRPASPPPTMSHAKIIALVVLALAVLYAVSQFLPMP